jgi:mannan endo-1,4-beta-mannosidase
VGERTAAFVTTAGREFHLGGRPFYFQGTNFRDLAFLTDHSEREVYAWVAQLAAHGLKVIRLFAATHGGEFDGVPMIESVGPEQAVYNEAGLRRLDAALDAARVADVRVILVLVNFEPYACGMHWWVRQVRGDGEREAFYTDPAVRRAFKRHIETLLTRVNGATLERTGTRVAYRDDPTIMAVEAANEPHTADLYERRRGLPPGELVHSWLADITAHIRSVDPNHLISTGEEGYKTGGPAQGLHHWIEDGWKGVDFARNLNLPTVDFATVHIYPDAWEIPASRMGFVRERILGDRARIAHALAKPIVLEECGFDASGRFPELGYGEDPARYLRMMFRYANAFGYAGTLVWQALPPGLCRPDYDFDTGSPQFRVVKEQARSMNARNARWLSGLFRRFRRA